LEDLSIDRRIISKPVFNKEGRNARTWSRQGQVTVPLWKWSWTFRFLQHTDRITNDEVFQRAKEERLILKILKHRCNSWLGHIIRCNEFVVNIIEGAISGKKAMRRPQLQYLKQVTRKQEVTAMKRTACNCSRWKAANQ
jgi:hypothetical protein